MSHYSIDSMSQGMHDATGLFVLKCYPPASAMEQKESSKDIATLACSSRSHILQLRAFFCLVSLF